MERTFQKPSTLVRVLIRLLKKPQTGLQSRRRDNPHSNSCAPISVRLSSSLPMWLLKLRDKGGPRPAAQGGNWPRGFVPEPELFRWADRAVYSIADKGILTAPRGFGHCYRPRTAGCSPQPPFPNGRFYFTSSFLTAPWCGAPFEADSFSLSPRVSRSPLA